MYHILFLWNVTHSHPRWKAVYVGQEHKIKINAMHPSIMITTYCIIDRILITHSKGVTAAITMSDNLQLAIPTSDDYHLCRRSVFLKGSSHWKTVQKVVNGYRGNGHTLEYCHFFHSLLNKLQLHIMSPQRQH